MSDATAATAAGGSVAAPLLEPFFFDGLFGVWRAPGEPAAAPRRVWVFCAPFAEEEKSARRVLVQCCEALVRRGDATLIFSYRGTGDSEGDFHDATLQGWTTDIVAACAEARSRAPGATLCLAGLRLGAGLALQAPPEVQAERLVLIEPVLQGKTVLGEIRQKKRLRQMVTNSEGGSADALPDDDFDGWPISAALRESLEAFQAPTVPADTRALLIGVGPRTELAPPLQSWAREAGAATVAVRMPAFWNRLDTLDAAPLLDTISQW